jgi:hypothetical protein
MGYRTQNGVNVGLAQAAINALAQAKAEKERLQRESAEITRLKQLALGNIWSNHYNTALRNLQQIVNAGRANRPAAQAALNEVRAARQKAEAARALQQQRAREAAERTKIANVRQAALNNIWSVHYNNAINGLSGIVNARGTNAGIAQKALNEVRAARQQAEAARALEQKRAREAAERTRIANLKQAALNNLSNSAGSVNQLMQIVNARGVNAGAAQNAVNEIRRLKAEKDSIPTLRYKALNDLPNSDSAVNRLRQIVNSGSVNAGAARNAVNVIEKFKAERVSITTLKKGVEANPSNSDDAIAKLEKIAKGGGPNADVAADALADLERQEIARLKKAVEGKAANSEEATARLTEIASGTGKNAQMADEALADLERQAKEEEARLQKLAREKARKEKEQREAKEKEEIASLQASSEEDPSNFDGAINRLKEIVNAGGVNADAARDVLNKIEKLKEERELITDLKDAAEADPSNIAKLEEIAKAGGVNAKDAQVILDRIEKVQAERDFLTTLKKAVEDNSSQSEDDIAKLRGIANGHGVNAEDAQLVLDEIEKREAERGLIKKALADPSNSAEAIEKLEEIVAAGGVNAEDANVALDKIEKLQAERDFLTTLKKAVKETSSHSEDDIAELRAIANGGGVNAGDAQLLLDEIEKVKAEKELITSLKTAAEEDHSKTDDTIAQLETIVTAGGVNANDAQIALDEIKELKAQRDLISTLKKDAEEDPSKFDDAIAQLEQIVAAGGVEAKEAQVVLDEIEKLKAEFDSITTIKNAIQEAPSTPADAVAQLKEVVAAGGVNAKRAQAVLDEIEKLEAERALIKSLKKAVQEDASKSENAIAQLEQIATADGPNAEDAQVLRDQIEAAVKKAEQEAAAKAAEEARKKAEEARRKREAAEALAKKLQAEKEEARRVAAEKAEAEKRAKEEAEREAARKAKEAAEKLAKEKEEEEARKKKEAERQAEEERVAQEKADKQEIENLKKIVKNDPANSGNAVEQLKEIVALAPKWALRNNERNP